MTTKRSPKAIALNQLDQLLNQNEAVQWQIGDLLVEMIDGKLKMKLKEIAKRYAGQRGRSYSRMSEYYTVAKAVPKHERIDGIPHFQYQVAVKGVKAIESEFSKELNRPYKINVAKAVKEVNINGGGRGASRQFTKRLGQIERKKVLPERKVKAKEAVKNAPKEIINNLHFGDYVKTLEKMPENSIQLLHLDAPYAHYIRSKDGSLDFSSSGSSITACANMTQPEAIKTTCAAFALATTRLRKNGAIVLWQAARHLRVPIIEAIENAGFQILPPWIWDKKVAQPGDLISANSLSAEFAWLIARPSETVFNLDHSDRQLIHTWPVPKNRAAKFKEWHFMEKPPEANRFLIEKITTEGDLIFDAFGCSAGMCVEAAKLKRRWVYCEMQKECFDLGTERMAEFENSNSTPKVLAQKAVETIAELQAA